MDRCGVRTDIKITLFIEMENCELVADYLRHRKYAFDFIALSLIWFLAVINIRFASFHLMTPWNEVRKR